MFFIAVAVFGVISYRSLGASLNPNVTFPIVVVTANYPGASPAEMERLVIKPIEDQIDGIDNLDQMSATAQEGTPRSSCSSSSTRISTTPRSTCSGGSTPRASTCRPTSIRRPSTRAPARQQAPILTLAVSSKTLSADRARGLDRRTDRLRASGTSPTCRASTSAATSSASSTSSPIPRRLMGRARRSPTSSTRRGRTTPTFPAAASSSRPHETSVSVHADINRARDMLGIPLPTLSPSLGADSPVATGCGSATSRTPTTATSSSGSSRTINGDPTVDARPQPHHDVGRDQARRPESRANRSRRSQAHYPQVHFPTKSTRRPTTRRASLNGVLQSLIEGIVLTALVLMLFLHAWRNALVVMIAIPSLAARDVHRDARAALHARHRLADGRCR